MWRNHYEDLLNSNTNTDKMVTILDTFGNVCSHVGMNVTMSEASQIVRIYLMGNLLDLIV